MASSRITAVNEVISTYGDNTRDYQVGELSVWESATDNDLVTANQSQRLDCYADASSYADRVLMSASITDATRFRTIRAANGHAHGGIPNTGVVFTGDGTDNGTFALAEGYASVYDICATMNNNSANLRFVFDISNTGNPNKRVTNCIAFNGTNSGTGVVYGFNIPTDQCYVVNCLAINNESHGFRSVGGTTNFLYNCTSVNNGGAGFRNDASTTISLKNCLGYNNSGGDFSNAGTVTGNNNASSDGTALGTSPRINQTFTFVNAASSNFHLATNDAGALGFGANLSADSTFAFDDDVDGETISTWSIGFDSRVAAGSSSPSFYYYSLVR